MQTLFLARHAFAGSNRDQTVSCTVPGEGLTPEGVEQARRLGASLLGEEIHLGISSAFRRARETLELALGERSDVATATVTELNEVDFGSYDGGPLEAYRAWAADHPPGLEAPGGGESRAGAAARYARALRLLLARPEETLLAVSHALAVRYVVDAAHELPPAPLIAPVEHGVAQRLTASQVSAAATLLEDWSRAPRFRRE